MSNNFRRALLSLVGLLCVIFSSFAQQPSIIPPIGKDLNAHHVVADDKIKNTGRTLVAGKIAITGLETLSGLSNDLTGLEYEGKPKPTVLAEAFPVLIQLNDFYSTISNEKSEEGRPVTKISNAELLKGLDASALPENRLKPGIYYINESLILNNALKLVGDPAQDQAFIFIIGNNLSVENTASVTLEGIKPGNVYWVSKKNININNDAYMWGCNLVANGNIDFKSGSSLAGRAWSLDGSVFFDSNKLILPADLSVEKPEIIRESGSPVDNIGDIVSFKVKVKGDPNSSAFDVVVTNMIPDGLEYISYTSTKAGSTFDPQTGNWRMDKLAANEEQTIIIKTRIKKSGKIWYSAGIQSLESIDPVSENDYQTVDLCVVMPDAGTITGDAVVCVGQKATYSVPALPFVNTYNWSVPQGWILTKGADPNIIIVEPTPGSALTGTITLTVRDGCGPSKPSVFTVTQSTVAPSQPGPISGDVKLCISTKATFSIEPVAGATSYQWTIPAGWEVIGESNGTSITIDTKGNAAAKELSVVAVGACGNSPVRTRTVTPIVVVTTIPGSISGAAKVCATAQGIEYKINAVSGAESYVWTVPTGWSIVSGQGTTSVKVNAGAQAGDITVIAKNSCGDSAPLTLKVTPTQNAPLTPGAITGSSVVCTSSASNTYSIAAVTGAVGYVWSAPTGWVITEGQGTTSIKVTAPAGATTGKITVVAQNECGSNGSSSIDVQSTGGSPAKPGAISGTLIGCTSKTATYTIAPVAGAASYKWTLPTGWSIASGDGTTSVTVNVGAGTGTISVRGVNNCNEGEATSINVAPISQGPAKPGVITGQLEVCRDTEGFVYKVNDVQGATSYNWTVPAGWTITSGQGTTSITVKSTATEGAITVSAVNDCGTSATTELQVKVVPSPPAQPEAITGSTSVCNGQQNLTYAVNPVAGATRYDWTAPGWTIVSGQGTTSIVVTAGSANTTISVVAVNACGVTGPAQLKAVVTQVVPAKPGAITGEPLSCISKELTYSIAPVANATGYTWAVPQGWSIISGQGTTAIKVKVGSATGEVTVAATNGCGTSAASSLAVTTTSENPTGITAIAGNNAACANSTATYSVEKSPNAKTYTWAVPAGWSIVSGQGTNQVTVKAGNTAGEISITATNDCGSTRVSRTIGVSTSLPSDAGAITGNSSVCSASVQYYSIAQVAGATGYTWSVPADWKITAGQNTTSITVQAGEASGDVTVVATNACGNSKAAVKAVAITSTSPVISAINGSASVCAGTTAGLIYSIAPVANSTYTWAVSGDWEITAGQGTASVTVKAGTQAGEITVQVKNECGNGASKTLKVQVQGAPVAPSKIEGSATACGGSEVTFTTPALEGVDSYIWSVPADWKILSGQGTTSVKVIVSNKAGAITVVAKNACSTSAAASMTVTPASGVPAAPVAIKGTTTVCVGRELTLSVDAVRYATGYTWTMPEGWAIVAGQGTRTVTVVAGSNAGNATVTANNGCGASAPVSVSLTSTPLALTTGTITDLSGPCTGLMYEIAPVEGAVTYNWTVPAGWTITSGQGTTKITVAAGETNGMITVSADNGTCSAQAATMYPDKSLAGNVLTVPNVFSPNGDGNYDTWQVVNLENFPDNDLTVLNRWGNEVYKVKGYRNGWDGSNLTEGTYYYLLRVKLCDGTNAMYKGYLTIVR